MSKTIKQIADELGVSKQSVQKRLSREPLYTSIQPYVYTQNGVKYIEVVGENLIKSAFYKTGIDTMSIDKNDHLSIPLYTPIIETLQATIDTLQEQLNTKDKQLAAKDEQIRRQQEQIQQLTSALQKQTSALESITAALTVAQALHAADKKALMLMEDRESEHKLSFWERRAAKKAKKKA